MEHEDVRLSRRSFVGGASIALAGSVAGCMGMFGPENPDLGEPVELTVKSLPSDEDPPAAGIARRLTENLNDIGADATLVPKSAPEMAVDVFLDNDFDIFVAKYPGVAEPDELRTLLHSTFQDERGWQNPFGFSDPDLDGLLDQQKLTDHPERQESLEVIQELIVEHQPFSVVAIPDELTAVGSHLQSNWSPPGLTSPFDLLRLGTEAGDRLPVFRIGILDGRITFDHNPLTPAFPLQAVLTGLLYDSLFVNVGGSYIPWLAQERTWFGDDDSVVFEVSIHEGISWHDGTPLTAHDIEFTYRFISDLSLEAADLPIPAPRFRGRSSVVDTVTALDDTTVRFEMGHVGRDVSSRALTVPILPQHIWEPRHALDAEGLPDALTTENEEPVGSGPFMFEDAEMNQYLSLSRYPGHFLESDAPITPGEPAFDSIPFNHIEFVMPTRPPTVGTALSLVENEELDIISRVPAHEAATVARSSFASLEARPSNKFYLIGYNTNRFPCSDRSFRRLIGRLIDRTFIVALIFRGYAQPADSPLAMTEYVNPALEWSGQSKLGEFPGASGILDIEQARSFFLENGFEFENNRLFFQTDEPG